MMTPNREQRLLDFVERTVADNGLEYAEDMLSEWDQCLSEMAQAGINVAGVKQEADAATRHFALRPKEVPQVP